MKTKPKKKVCVRNLFIYIITKKKDNLSSSLVDTLFKESYYEINFEVAINIRINDQC